MTSRYARRVLRHLPWFFLASVVCVGIALLWEFRRDAMASVTTQAERSNAMLALALTNTVVRAHGDLLHLADEDKPGVPGSDSSAQALKFGRAMTAALEGVTDVKIRLFDRHGVVVYSTQPQQLGLSLTGSGGAVAVAVAAAMRGQLLSELEFQDEDSRVDGGGVLDRDLVRTFVPVRLSADGRVQGVLQVTSDVTDLWVQQREAMVPRAWAVVAAMGALYALLLVAVRYMREVVRYGEAARLKHVTKLTDLALKDGLTGVLNRRAWDDFVRRSDGRTPSRGLAILMIDLDHFKPVNDQHGHAVGDLLLKAVATRLRECIGERGRVYRLGGDEFVAVIGEGETRRIEALSARIVAAVQVPVDIDGIRVQVGASVGVAVTRERRQADIAQLVKNADEALYRAKSRGRGAYVLASAQGPWQDPVRPTACP